MSSRAPSAAPRSAGSTRLRHPRRPRRPRRPPLRARSRRDGRRCACGPQDACGDASLLRGAAGGPEEAPPLPPPCEGYHDLLPLPGGAARAHKHGEASSEHDDSPSGREQAAAAACPPPRLPDEPLPGGEGFLSGDPAAQRFAAPHWDLFIPPPLPRDDAPLRAWPPGVIRREICALQDEVAAALAREYPIS
jgi:hypothetical protein